MAQAHHPESVNRRTIELTAANGDLELLTQANQQYPGRRLCCARDTIMRGATTGNLEIVTYLYDERRCGLCSC